MGKSSHLSSGEKKTALVSSALLVVLIAFGVASAATESSTSTSSPPPAPEPTAAPAPESTSTDDIENQKRHIKDQLNHAKNLRQDLERIKKEAPELDVGSLLDQVGKFESCINAVQPGVEDFWGVLSPCDEYRKIVEDDLNDRLRPIQYCKDLSRGVKDRKRERKDLDRGIKDILRQDKTADVSALQTLLGQIDAALAQAEPFLKCTSTDDRDGLDGLGRDIGDLFQDFYNLKQEVWDKANLIQRRVDNKKDFEKNIKRQCEKEYTREMKQLEKDFNKVEKAGQLTDEDRANFTAAKDNFTAVCVTQIGLMQQALDSDDQEAFEDARNEFHTLNQDFWQLMQTAREGFNVKQQFKDVMRDINQWKKNVVQMRKEYERAAKKGGANAEIEALLKEIENTYAQAEEVVKTDPQSWWQDYQQTINDLQNRFWELHQEVFQKAEQVKNTERWLKDLERDLKFREKDLKNMKKDKNLDASVLSALEEIFGQMKSTVARAREVLGTDPQAAEDLLREYDEFRFQWDETSRSLWEANDFKFQLGETLRVIEFVRKELGRLADEGRLEKDKLSRCLDFVDKVETGVKSLGPKDDIEDHLDSFENEMNEVCPVIDEFVGEGPPPPDHAYYEEFFEENVKGIKADIAADILTKVSEDLVSEVMRRLSSDPSVTEAFLKAVGTREDIAANTFEAVTIYDEAEQKEILSKKAEILELEKQLEGLQVQLKAAQDQLAAIRNEIASYNFYGDAADNIRDQMERLIAEIQSATDEKTKQRLIAELNDKKNVAIDASKQAKWQEKKIPFLDSDDNFWGTKHIAKAARCEFARGKGDGSNFDPGGDVLVAEILTMAFRASRDPEPRGNSNLCDGKYKGHWGNKFIRWAEDKGLSIASACTDADRPALRWEIAQVLGELAAGDKLPASSEACFSDVKASDKSPNAAVCYAQAKGFMKGTDGKSNAYSRVNRAEAATMVVSVAERLLGFQCSANVKERPTPSLRRGSGDDEDEDDEDENEDEHEFDDEFEEDENETGDNTGIFE